MSANTAYVGISHRIESRLGQHRRTKPWTEIASISIEHYRSRERAEEAERRAIHTERPLWNVIHQARAPAVIDPCVCHRCTRQIADRRTHYLARGKVWCLRCAEKQLLVSGCFASCAVARRWASGEVEIPEAI